jgi:hypothetical protein
VRQEIERSKNVFRQPWAQNEPDIVAQSLHYLEDLAVRLAQSMHNGVVCGDDGLAKHLVTNQRLGRLRITPGAPTIQVMWVTALQRYQSKTLRRSY